ncbi:5-formyltetrahydrofolate cyclo-ligase [Vibrio hippocampi]|nr:5-formyltetrahydrofolate cyclo-ligase [Vibrio hippocampi]
MTQRQSLRQLIRQQRQSLSYDEQQQAAQDLVVQLANLDGIAKAKRVALYLAADGELDVTPAINWFWDNGIETYLPVIHPFSKGHLLFLRYHSETPLVHNRYQIREPKLDKTQICPVAELDIIFTPLVAFDRTGQRLGMGGGYYDRTLQPWRHNNKGPSAIGLAHHCQLVEQLPTEAWDVPLATIVTPQRIWCW